MENYEHVLLISLPRGAECWIEPPGGIEQLELGLNAGYNATEIP